MYRPTMSADLIESLPDALFLGRLEMRSTVEELAELVGVTPSAIEAFEAGASVPNPSVLVGLAGVLALDLGALLDLYPLPG